MHGDQNGTLSRPTRLIRKFVTASLLAGACAFAVPASAASFIVGQGSNNSYGTGVFINAGTNVRYQQVFGAAAFSSLTDPVEITSFSLFAAAFDSWWGEPIPPEFQTISTGNYTIRFSTTSRSVDGLADNFNSNWGSDVAVFFSGNIADTLTVNGTGFTYDPSMGNLLMDVTVHSQTYDGAELLRAHETLAQFNGGNRDQISSRYGGSGATAVTTGIGWTRSSGYVVDFGYADPTSAIPEPATWAMLIAGFGLVGTQLRRRNRVRQATA